MSQYPIPYQQPNYVPPASDPRAAARRAGILMVVLGGCTLLCGICMGVLSASFTSLQSQMPAESTAEIQNLASQLHISAQALIGIFAVMFLTYAILFIAMGLFTRRGGVVSVVLSLVVTCLVLMYFIISTVTAAFGPPSIGPLLVSLLPLAAHILLLIWLIRAAKNASAVKAMSQQQTQQYWQYQQMQQQYYQQAAQQYGYPQQQPPQQQPPAQPPPGGS